MARISPRFLTCNTARGYRFAEEVPAHFGECMSATRARGEVNFCLTRSAEEGAPRVYISLTYAEAERLGAWATECRKERPHPHHMNRRVYLIDGTHRATIRGWWNGPDWEPDTTEPPECLTASLSVRTVRALYAMASVTGADWTIDGQRIEHLI